MTTSYFFFAIVNTVAIPFYVSQTIAITYADNIDLTNQQNAYFNALLSAARSDGQDPANYTEQASTAYTDSNVCDSVRSTYISDVRNNGQTVIEKTL